MYFLCQKNSPLAKRLFDAPFEVNSDYNLNHFGPISSIRATGKINRILTEFRPDILNPHCPPGHTYLAFARRQSGLRIPLIRSVADPRPPKTNWLNRRLHLQSTQGFLFTTVTSLHRYRSRFDVDSVGVRVSLPGFRADDFLANTDSGEYRSRFGLRNDQLLCAIIARMSPEKGQEVLLNALSLLDPGERQRFFFVFAGEDSRERGRADLQRIAEQLGVQNHVAFIGRLEDVRPLMADLDLALITSTRSEAICRVALEYMTFGLPIISSNVNILPEVVRDGKNGWVFSNGDAMSLARCLREAVSNPVERKRRGEYGLALLRTDFSLQREIDDTLEFFETQSARFS